MDLPQIPRVAQLTDQLWTGGALPYRSDRARSVIDTYRKVGINAVLDTREGCSDEEFVKEHAPEIDYFNAGVIDGGQRLPEAWFAVTTDWVREHLLSGSGVLVHCSEGLNRGPSAAFAVLLTLGWDPTDAIELIHEKLPRATVSYAEQALEWHHRLSLTRFNIWRNNDRISRSDNGRSI